MSIGTVQRTPKEYQYLLVNPNEIPVYTGPSSVHPGSKRRPVNRDWDDMDKKALLDWPKQYLRRYSPLRSPRDNHVLTDNEIERLLNALRNGWEANNFESTEEMLEFLKFREAVPEKVYGMFEQDITICRFFSGKIGEKQENILADIRAINEKEGMGNIKVPDTSLEIINYSPCPKCETVHSFSDIFHYYMHPTPDETFKNENEQRSLDTRVQCKECGSYFLPALIITDGNPRNEYQMICRSQTLREVTVFMQQEFKLRVLTLDKNNILPHPTNAKKAGWRNDIDSSKLKLRPALFANVLQYTPAPLMLDFLSRKNLVEKEPIFGAWCNKDAVTYYDL
jgi:hypothetical protein